MESGLALFSSSSTTVLDKSIMNHCLVIKNELTADFGEMLCINHYEYRIAKEVGTSQYQLQ